MIKKYIGITTVILAIVMIFLLSGQAGQESNRITSSILEKVKNINGQGFNATYLRMVRKGNSFSTYYSSNGRSWKMLDQAVEINLSNKVLIGMGVTSHNRNELCKTVFSNVRLESINKNHNNQWKNSDIWNVGEKGSYTVDEGKFIILGSGNDIWRGPDGFHYVYQLIEGDFSLQVRIDFMDMPDRWAKAGIVARESLDYKSNYTAITINPNDYINMHWRKEGNFEYRQIEREKLTNQVFRKILHYIGYLFFAMVLFYTIKQFIKRNISAVLIAFHVCFLLALFDEIHQMFIPGRTPEASDVVIDSLGAITGIAVAFIISLFKKRNFKPVGIK